MFAPEGKALTSSHLSAALKVLGPSLGYVSHGHDDASAALEFEANLDGVYVQGVDILRWNAQGKLISFMVMVRPLRGLQKLIELMVLQLAAGQAESTSTSQCDQVPAHAGQDVLISAQPVPLTGQREPPGPHP